MGRKGKKAKVIKRPPPKQEPELVGGKIMFLPPKYNSMEIVDPYLHDRPSHPVVVISRTPDADGTVEIRLITIKFSNKILDIAHKFWNKMLDIPRKFSNEMLDEIAYVFLKKTLKKSHTNKALVKSHYVPLEPSEPHPEDGTLLRLANGCRKSILKNYVINTDQVFHIAFPILRNYNGASNGGEELALCPDSYDELLRCLDIIEKKRQHEDGRQGVRLQRIGAQNIEDGDDDLNDTHVETKIRGSRFLIYPWIVVEDLTQFASPATVAWNQEIAKFSAYILISPEYHSGIPGALKNAIDHLYHAWTGKPVMVLTYGEFGGAEANAQLRQVLGVGCQMKVASVGPKLELPGRDENNNNMSLAMFQAMTGVVSPQTFKSWEEEGQDVLAGCHELLRLKDG
ncbi:uncharacterized protein DNG_09225 [Cephalotrichum gorgonifer]|uniref:NADPH-dependent FMN reductase-like domain-containing protein n=1 Tax=Cephalotrichum gorgonifer TaxID=2041049 RepID=A0AAE8N823_9PEZI|nr:uncharacterized protein DNG_09225 [Cephalotrichum gorgonifer]